MEDYMPPEIGIPLAIILWTIVLVQWRRDVIKRRKAERQYR